VEGWFCYPLRLILLLIKNNNHTYKHSYINIYNFIKDLNFSFLFFQTLQTETRTKYESYCKKQFITVKPGIIQPFRRLISTDDLSLHFNKSENLFVRRKTKTGVIVYPRL